VLTKNKVTQCSQQLVKRQLKQLCFQLFA